MEDLGVLVHFCLKGYRDISKSRDFFFIRIHKHAFSPRSKSPMKHCSTPSSFTPERNRNNQPRLNIIMNPPKPSKTTYLPSTHRLLLTLRRCEKQQRNWRASKPLQGFPTNEPITNIHFIIISLSVVLVGSSFSPSFLPFPTGNLHSFVVSYALALYGPQDPAVRQDTALLLVPWCCISCPQRQAVAKKRSLENERL